MTAEREHDLRAEFVDRLHVHQGLVRKVCAVWSREPEDRADLFQEIALQLWRAYPTFRGEASFASWAYRVALNTAILRRRGADRRPREESRRGAAEEPAPTGADPLERREGAHLLHECIRELRDLDRAIILLHLEERPHAEIAAATGLSVTNVGVRIHRIRKTLREHLLARGYAGEGAP